MTEVITVVLLGFFLGMRHATDPDHVIAVTTIVSRQRTIRAAAAIGILWGVGHTLTIMGVGGAIILFGLVVPPRLGLSLELAVALMLIVLGILALTGLRPSTPPGTGPCTPTPTATTTTSTRTPTPTSPGRTATTSTGRRRRGSIAGSAGFVSTRRCGRSSSASSTGSPARPPSPCSSSPRSGARCGPWRTCSSSASARSRA